MREALGFPGSFARGAAIQEANADDGVNVIIFKGAGRSVYRCGLTKSLELCITGRMITGIEAEKVGMINKAYPADKLEEEVERIASGLAKLPRDGIALGKVSRHYLYDELGITKGLTHSYIMHTMTNNMSFEPGEFNFFKQRRDQSVKDAARGKRDFFKELDK